MVRKLRMLFDITKAEPLEEDEEDRTFEIKTNLDDEFRIAPHSHNNEWVTIDFGFGEIVVSQTEFLDEVKKYRERYRRTTIEYYVEMLAKYLSQAERMDLPIPTEVSDLRDKLNDMKLEKQKDAMSFNEILKIMDE